MWKPSADAAVTAGYGMLETTVNHHRRARRAVVVGGGIGGLAAAIALARVGVEVAIYEKRADRTEDGAGIQIGPNGTRILEALGVAATLAPHVATPRRLEVRDGISGNGLAQLPLGDWLAQRHGAPYWVAHRADLHRALLDTARMHPLIAHHEGVEVVAAESHPGEAILHGAHGAIAAADVVVAADGLRSRLREGIAGPSSLRYAGKSAARTVLPRDAVPRGIPADAVGIWLSPAGHVVHYPVRAGRELAIVVIRNEPKGTEGWATAVEPASVASAVATFPPLVRRLVAAAGDWRKWSLYAHPPLPRFASDRMALLGDAAHPVFPFLAQGAVLALEDAATLARCLSDDPDTQSALARYDALRRPRANRVQDASRENGRVYHLDGRLRTARNLALRLAPPARLMASYDWLYGWRL